jgi:hypothetical protein
MSRESDFAWRAARFYGPERLQMSRAERIEFLRVRVTQLANLAHEERTAHEANCPQCQADEFCLQAFSVQSARSDERRFLRRLIGNEEQDEAYAQRAKVHPVKYGQHIGGCRSYWQNLRHRKFEAAGWRCEICGNSGPLDAHHLHYDTLGFEELCDLQALCRKCHENTDSARTANTVQER